MPENSWVIALAAVCSPNRPLDSPAMLGYLAFLWVYKIVESVRGTPPRLPTSRIGAAAGLVVAGFWVVRLVVFFAQGGLQVMARDNLVARFLRLIS